MEKTIETLTDLHGLLQVLADADQFEMILDEIRSGYAADAAKEAARWGEYLDAVDKAARAIDPEMYE